MRIALTHAYCWPEVRRGAERFTQELGAALLRRGHQVTLFSSAWDTAPSPDDLVPTVRLRRRIEHGYRHETWFGLALLPRLTARRFDAVHCFGRHDAVAAVRSQRLRRDGRTTVMTDLGIPDRPWWRTQGSLQARAAAQAIAEIDVYSGMSRAAVAALAASYGRDDGVVVPGGVRLAAFAPAAERSADPVVLFSGAIEERRKGVPVLLRALTAVLDHHPTLQLWLSGPGSGDPLLAELPGALQNRLRPHVHNLGVGAAQDQAERYARAWVTTLPSMHDSFGMALIESLACGTPLVTTTHAAPPELVQPGVTGELCRPEDPEDLARALLRALELSRRAETAAACRAFARGYDWDLALAPLCEELYARPPRRRYGH